MEKYVRATLAILPLCGILAIIGYILGSGMPADETESSLLLMLAGVLTALTKDGSAFYMSTNQSSTDKTKALIDNQKTKE